MDSTRIVLGIDSGIASCGYALVRFGTGTRECLRAGIVETKADPEVPKRDDVLARAQRIAEEIWSNVSNACGGSLEVDVLAIEDVVGAPNRNTQHACSCTVGSLAGWFAARARPAHTALFDPGEIKRVFGAPAWMSKMEKSWVSDLWRPYYADVDGKLSDLPLSKRNHAWDAVATAEAAVLLRPEWFDGVDPWEGIRKAPDPESPDPESPEFKTAVKKLTKLPAAAKRHAKELGIVLTLGEAADLAVRDLVVAGARGVRRARKTA